MTYQRVLCKALSRTYAPASSKSVGYSTIIVLQSLSSGKPSTEFIVEESLRHEFFWMVILAFFAVYGPGVGE
jgi:hypothetical protein